MKMLKINEKLFIVDGKNPLKYVDMSTKQLHTYPGYIDEAGEWPSFKWWRNLIKWYQWRRVLKVANKNTKYVLTTSTPVDKFENYIFRKEK